MPDARTSWIEDREKGEGVREARGGGAVATRQAKRKKKQKINTYVVH